MSESQRLLAMRMKRQVSRVRTSLSMDVCMRANAWCACASRRACCCCMCVCIPDRNGGSLSPSRRDHHATTRIYTRHIQVRDNLRHYFHCAASQARHCVTTTSC